MSFNHKKYFDRIFIIKFEICKILVKSLSWMIFLIQLTPDIADVGFIIGYMLSPDDVFESCGLGMIGVLEPGPGGPPPGGPPP